MRRGSTSAQVDVLVHEAADGNDAAWNELVFRFDGLIRSVGRSCELPTGRVGELRQATWLRLVESLSGPSRPDRVATWLAATAARESLRLLPDAPTV